MSLYEEADGLLDTHVTWQDVEDEMRKALGTKARFGENKKATNISDMKGFMSRIALVEPDWTGQEATENLPKKFAVKMSSQLALSALAKQMATSDDIFPKEKLDRMSELTRTTHNREVQVYRLLSELDNKNIPITKIYCLKEFSDENPLKGYIISEYVDNIHPVMLHDSLSIEDLKIVIKACAAFSAIGENISRSQLSFAGGPEYLAMIVEKFFDARSMAETGRLVRRAFNGEYVEEVEEVLKLYNDFYSNAKFSKKYTTVSEFLGFEPVLTHADLWCNNLLFNRIDDHVVLRAIIDWQTVAICNPGQDVGRLFLTCLSTEDRHQHTEELLEYYYDCFVSQLDDKSRIPYTLQQLKDSYDLYFPIMTTLVLPSIIPLLDLSKMAEGEREKVAKAAKMKSAGMLLDVLEYHKKNLQRFPEFYKKDD